MHFRAIFSILKSMIRIHKKIKLLSINESWRGRRYKTKKYEVYQNTLLLTLPRQTIGYCTKYYTIFIFNFSNKNSDWDNPIKPLQDILQKKYGFNDRDITISHVRKNIVPKKDEGFIVYIGNADFYDRDYKKIFKEVAKK